LARLIAVSNRVPTITDEPPSGGLSVALDAALTENGGVWFGWSGQTSVDPTTKPTLEQKHGYTLATIDLPPRELAGYYEQYANRTLWPLLHGRLDLASFEHSSYALYRKVNRRFARVLKTLIAPDDIVWIHDYHLIPLGMELRTLGVTAPMGFFLHTPFPGPDMVGALPWRDDVFDHLSAYDLVGFQTANCVHNFRGSALQFAASGVHVGHYPIGIDTKKFVQRSNAPTAQRWFEHFRACMGDQVWAVGAERLD
jgi:trehalose 6-phosphate synthase